MRNLGFCRKKDQIWIFNGRRMRNLGFCGKHSRIGSVMNEEAGKKARVLGIRGYGEKIGGRRHERRRNIVGTRLDFDFLVGRRSNFRVMV